MLLNEAIISCDCLSTFSGAEHVQDNCSPLEITSIASVAAIFGVDFTGPRIVVVVLSLCRSYQSDKTPPRPEKSVSTAINTVTLNKQTPIHSLLFILSI